MIIGIVGLGLIGGSFAKAYARSGWKVMAYDVDNTMLEFAKLSGAVHETLTEENLPSCDLLLLCTYPAAAEDFLKENAPIIGKHTVVIDCLGTKKRICEVAFPLAKQHGFFFAGGHPMAGTHNSGFKYAKESLFRGAPMVIVPPEFDDMQMLDNIKMLLSPAGFGSFSVTTAEQHDKMIGFTSQMPHILSNAFIKSPTAREHKGFSAGSYKDLTRVAWLNPTMWTELFLENGDNLVNELNFYIDSLTQYRDAIENQDAETLWTLLDEGRSRKKEIDGR